MISGITLPKENKLQSARENLSDYEKQILDSVVKNDEYRLKSSKNINPTAAQVANLPDIYSQGFILIYNQLQSLLGSQTESSKTAGTGEAKRFGALLSSLGIGLQEFGTGLEMLGNGLSALGNPAALAGVGVATLALVAITAFIAGLSYLETQGLGVGTLIKSTLIALSEGLLFFFEGLMSILSENSEFVEMYLTKLIEALQALGPVIKETAPIVEAGLESLSAVFIGFIENLSGIIDSIAGFATDLIDTMFTNITTTIKTLANDVDGENLLLVSAGVLALGAALTVFGAGSFVEAFLSLFSNENALIEKLARFADLGPNLALAGSGLKAFASGLMDLSKVSLGSVFRITEGEVDRVVNFVVAFDRPDFKNALRNLEVSLPAFSAFSTAFSYLAMGIEDLANLDDNKYDKALERMKEIVSLSQQAGANFSTLSQNLQLSDATQVQDAVFTLDASKPRGTYFDTDQGLVQTSPDDNLTVIASTNSPNQDGGIKEFASQIASEFNILLDKLDEYIETLANKQPDITIVPQESPNTNSSNIRELLKVGI